MSLVKTLPGREYFCLWGFSRIRRGEIPGSLRIPEVFPARKILIRDILGFPAGD
jgi:hypothetical protein